MKSTIISPRRNAVETSEKYINSNPCLCSYGSHYNSSFKGSICMALITHVTQRALNEGTIDKFSMPV